MNYPAFRSIALTLLLISNLIFSQWISQNSGTQYPLYSVYFINGNTGFVGSQSDDYPNFIGGQVIRTTNGGITWQQVLIDTNLRVGDFYFFDSNTGFVVGGSYSTVGRIFKTTNGGINWVNVTPNSINSFLWNIEFLNPLTGYIGGAYGVYKSTDGGFNWNKILGQSNFLNFSFSRISFPDFNTGYYLADSGKVHKTINGGTNWQLVRSGGDSLFFDIKFLNTNTGFITGEAGRLFKTTNGGAAWVKINTPSTLNLYGVHFTGLNTGYLAGHQFALKTTNSGDSWFPVFNVNTRSLWSIYFSDVNTGYMVSDTGVIYKTTTGGVIGINPVSTEIPKDYSLLQNYPNPFNPVTNIKFSIPKSAFIKLAVYDMLGKEVESLVSQQLSPGTYVVDWNAAKFSSGIYMYKLITNNFSLVKKMSLVK